MNRTVRPNHRVRPLAALALTAMLAVAACGGDDGDDASGDPPAADDATATADAEEDIAADEAPEDSDTADTATTEPTESGEAPEPSETESADEVQVGGTLTFALPTDPIAVQPRGGGAGNDQLYVARQLFDSLLEQDPATGELIPWLAESWEVNDDATEFTFHLRDDVTFSDGTPLTAQIVKDNFDDVIESGAKASWVIAFFSGYQESTVVDEHTVTVTFSESNAPFTQAVATSGLGIVGPATLAVPFEDRATANLVGTGPFVLESYTTDSEIVLTRREGYAWPPANRSNPGDAYLERIVFKIVPEAGVRTGSLQSGQVQAIGGVPPQDVEVLRSDGFQLVVRPNPGITFGVSFVADHTPVNDVLVRRAIASAIDATDVRDTVLSPDFAVATSVLSQTTPAHVVVDELIPYDPAAAAALLDEAGWTLGADGVREKDGEKLQLVFGWLNNFGPNQASLELIQAQLAEVGIGTELQSTTGPEFLEALTAGSFDLVWGNLSRADGDVLRTSFSTAATNYYRIDDPELEDLLQQQLAAGDPAARNELLAQIQARIVEQAHQVPVFELTTVLALTDSVNGVRLGADSRLDQLTDAWVAS